MSNPSRLTAKTFVEGDVVVAIANRVERGVVVIVEGGEDGGRIAVEGIIHAYGQLCSR